MKQRTLLLVLISVVGLARAAVIGTQLYGQQLQYYTQSGGAAQGGPISLGDAASALTAGPRSELSATIGNLLGQYARLYGSYSNDFSSGQQSNSISGNGNTIAGLYNGISGDGNAVGGYLNFISQGNQNQVKGNYNSIS
jgi:hypothetical protein